MSLWCCFSVTLIIKNIWIQETLSPRNKVTFESVAPRWTLDNISSLKKVQRAVLKVFLRPWSTVVTVWFSTTTEQRVAPNVIAAGCQEALRCYQLLLRRLWCTLWQIKALSSHFDLKALHWHLFSPDRVKYSPVYRLKLSRLLSCGITSASVFKAEESSRNYLNICSLAKTNFPNAVCVGVH